MTTVDRMRNLAQLRDRGAISDAEYAAAKRELLQRVPDAEETAPAKPPSVKPAPPKPAKGETRNDPMPLLVIALLTAVVLALLAMLLGFSASVAGTIGVATLGVFTILLYRALSDDDIA